jgi:hypothetical protein
VPIVLPPLRARTGDVPLLVAHMIERHGNGRKYRVSAPTMAALERYPWPGNVRELENAVQRAIALCEPTGELALSDLVPLDPRWRGAMEVAGPVRPLREVLKEAERRHIERALEQTGGHRSQTADVLGISRKVLWEKMRDGASGWSNPSTEKLGKTLIYTQGGTTIVHTPSKAYAMPVAVSVSSPFFSPGGKVLVYASDGDPLGTNDDGNDEVFWLDLNKRRTVQITDTVDPRRLRT